MSLPLSSLKVRITNEDNNISDLVRKGYSTKLRSLTSGTASFVAQFSHYEQVPDIIRNKMDSFHLIH